MAGQSRLLNEDSIKKMTIYPNSGVLANNKFIVTIGSILTSFSKVKGIGKSIDYETKAIGGDNNFVHVVRKNAKVDSNILTLEKGIGRINPLILSATGEMEMGVKLPLPGSIIILDDNYEMKKMYTFEDIVILKWEISELDALGNQIIIDTLQFMHSGLTDRSDKLNTNNKSK